MTREQIAEILANIGKPGENQDEKIKAIQELGTSNRQGHGIEETLHSYEEW